MKVVVLGCGPSGLVAAHAAYSQGFDVMVMSAQKRPSHLWGCQYLHAPIPGITPLDRHVRVNYTLIGTMQQYREKVYGQEYDGTVSPGDLEQNHDAWDLRSSYERLWGRWGNLVVQVPIMNGNMAADVLPDFLRAGDIIFSTIPRPALCRSPKHIFDMGQVWAMGDSPDQRVPVRPPQGNTVMCNGDPDVGWYRSSEVYGYGTVEWPWRNGKKPPFEGVVPVQKPIYTDCNCLREVHYVGRYGRWQKGYLVHQVYEDVVATLTNLQGALF